MIIIRALVASLVITAALQCCCCCGEPAAEVLPALLRRDRVDIVGGYSLGGWLGDDLELYKPPYFDPRDGTLLAYEAVVEQTVVTIGWDEDFILIERYPPRVGFLHEPIVRHPEWYIVVVSTGEVQRALSCNEFLRLREQLGVPDSIELHDATEVYHESLR
jgi:hypothetical protein